MSYSKEDVANIERILETENFYEILQVPNDATDEQIKSAHKKLALLVHPDKNNAPKAKEAFCAVRKATAVLLDKNTRKEYDSYLRSPRGFCKDKFDLSDEAIDSILVGTVGIIGIVGIAAGLIAVYDWWTSSNKKKEEPKYE